MEEIIDIRAHHLFDFSRALVDEEFRERKYLREFCYSEDESNKIRKLMQSINNNTLVRVVLSKDVLCVYCDRDDYYGRNKESCDFEDSVWDARRLLGVIIPNEITSIRHLKNQHALYERLHSGEGELIERRYKKCKNPMSWKKIISKAHELYRKRRVA